MEDARLIKTTPTICVREDCLHYTKQPGDNLCYCKHSDKPHHLHDEPCPLHRVNWDEARKRVEEMRKRFAK